MNGETLIDISNIVRYYGDECAVGGISFSVSRGEVLGFLGPNGAGKSTTMQIISGVLAANEGTVTIAGHDIIENPVSAKQHIGFLPERPPLYADLTVDEYLSYCARLRKLPRNRVGGAMADCKERCGLEDQGGRLIANLSKGYQQRVGIAQSIIHSPAVVILDEPTSGLDPIQIQEIRQLINQLGEEHSVILSTHILTEVQSSCHRVLIINSGKIVLDEQLESLRGDGQLASCTVALANPPLPEELDRLEGVERVDSIDQYRYRICYQKGAAAPAKIASTAVENGWGLFELVPERDSLEETFLKVTHGELDYNQDSKPSP